MAEDKDVPDVKETDTCPECKELWAECVCPGDDDFYDDDFIGDFNEEGW